MIVGIGIDLIEPGRIRDVYERHPQRFVERILTEREREYVLQHKDPVQRLSGRWVAKEAAVKALGTGVADGVCWKEVEIVNNAAGKPELFLYGKAAQRALLLGATRYFVTITHSESLAMAQVILEA